MSTKSRGITKFVRVKESDAQLLPSADPPEGKPKGPKPEDPLKRCVRDLLDQGGRDEEEATAWCKDFLEMQGQVDEPTATDSANVREAERILEQTRHDLIKPEELEQCTRNRQALLGEAEFEARKRCRRDWDLNEKIRGTAVATDSTESRVRILLDRPPEFHRLAVLRLQLDMRTTELANHYSLEEADKKARKELGLPRVYHRKPEPDVALDVFGKSKEQRIKEIYAVDNERRPGERLIGPYSGVPPIYGKTRAQILEEAYEADAEGKKNR
jgi:hypothetical protein